MQKCRLYVPATSDIHGAPRARTGRGEGDCSLGLHDQHITGYPMTDQNRSDQIQSNQGPTTHEPSESRACLQSIRTSLRDKGRAARPAPILEARGIATARPVSTPRCKQEDLGLVAQAHYNSDGPRQGISRAARRDAAHLFASRPTCSRTATRMSRENMSALQCLRSEVSLHSTNKSLLWVQVE